jgi:aminoglycoside 6'-N-acetyltransferase
MDESLITFTPLQEKDFPLMHHWLNEEHVKVWWGKEGKSFENINSKYTRYLDGSEKTQGFIIHYDKKPIGYIQTYKIDDHPEYKKQLDIAENAAGLDLFIGEKNFTGKGLGTLVVKKFTDEIIFKIYDVVSCIADPSQRNLASIKAFQKAGFTYLKDGADKETGDKETVVRLARNKV